MEPNICISHDGGHIYIDDDSTTLAKCKRVGVLHDAFDYIGSVETSPRDVDSYNPPSLYQWGARDGGHWCVSRWSSIPPDPLWLIPGDEGVMITQLINGSLNFINTPLEHRHNLSIHEDDPELKILAENELLLWKGSRNTFIPFKRIHPQGYQGVWMSPNMDVGDMGWATNVYDKFTSGHVLVVCGHR